MKAPCLFGIFCFFTVLMFNILVELVPDRSRQLMNYNSVNFKPPYSCVNPQTTFSYTQKKISLGTFSLLSHYRIFLRQSLKAKLDIYQIIEDSKRTVDSPSKFTVGLKKVLINFATTYKQEKNED